MAKVKIKLNSAGVRELLKDPAIAKQCQDVAINTALKCGDGYEVQERRYPERTGAVILAVTSEAQRDNLENNTMLKALG